MGSLDIDSLFANNPLEETIDICPIFLKTTALKKSEFKDLLTKDLYFIFNILYKQIGGAAMGSPLGPSLANAFLAHHEQNWLDSCPLEYRPSYYRRYVDDIFGFSNTNKVKLYSVQDLLMKKRKKKTRYI